MFLRYLKVRVRFVPFHRAKKKEKKKRDTRRRGGVEPDLIPVRVSRHQDVRPQLPLRHRQSVGVAPRHDLVAVREAHPELPYLHHLRLGKARGLLEVPSHYVDVRCQPAEKTCKILLFLVAGTSCRNKRNVRARWVGERGCAEVGR